ncbi:unnamed protein product [Peronospora belbahrii]|uniref:Uncharacterized protein n=1 Tax=Peronospora belbahrii TaxID=622444 RepID=A0AAU9KXH8_9STRA|nr:unnamed protein product [Peronospora belbahrii]
MGVKVKSGKKLKVSAGADNIKTTFERKLTPKKRWIQLWSAQLDDDNSKEKDSGSASEGVEKEAEKNEATIPSTVATSPVSDGNLSDSVPCRAATVTIAKKEEEQSMSEQPIDVPTAMPLVPLPVEQKAERAVPVSVSTNAQEQLVETLKVSTTVTAMTTMTTGDDVSAMASSTSLELRVKTPLNNESSHLSPPLERNSPTTTASISPSTKVKDSDMPNSNTAAAASKFSPAATEQGNLVMKAKEDLPAKEFVASELERVSSSSSNSVSRGDNSYRREISDHHIDRDRKCSLERTESPMSEEAKRRAERRRKRKSNWDVGDPRKGGSPVADPPISAAAAAANQQSFAKYPPNRPSWRHSQSMMDIKPHFPTGHRSSSFYNNGSSSGGRRGFYHMSSLPQDRSRSAGRSSSRYSYGNSSSGGSNYR